MTSPGGLLSSLDRETPLPGSVDAYPDATSWWKDLCLHVTSIVDIANSVDSEKDRKRARGNETCALLITHGLSVREPVMRMVQMESRERTNLFDDHPALGCFPLRCQSS